MINYYNFTSEISWKGHGGFHKWTKGKYGQTIRTLKNKNQTNSINYYTLCRWVPVTNNHKTTHGGSAYARDLQSPSPIYILFFLVVHRPPPNPTSWSVYSSLLLRWIFLYPSLQNKTHIKNCIYSQRYIYTHTHPSLISCNWEAGFVLSGFRFKHQWQYYLLISHSKPRNSISTKSQ